MFQDAVLVCFKRIFRPPELVLCGFSFDLTRYAHDQGTGGDFLAFTHQGLGGNDAVIPDNGAVQQGGIHADKNMAAHLQAVDYGAMAYGHSVADGDWRAFLAGHAGMYDTVIFKQALLANGYFSQISPDDRARPDTGFISDFYISDNYSVTSG